MGHGFVLAMLLEWLITVEENGAAKEEVVRARGLKKAGWKRLPLAEKLKYRN